MLVEVYIKIGKVVIYHVCWQVFVNYVYIDIDGSKAFNGLGQGFCPLCEFALKDKFTKMKLFLVVIM